MTGKLIYLACPYTDPDPAVRLARFETANLVASYLYKAGCVVISPISMMHPIAEAHGLPLDWEFWQHADRILVERCAVVLVIAIDGWDKSTGISEEVSIAHELGIPVGYLLNPTCEEMVVRFVRKAGLIEIDMNGRAWGESATYVERQL